MMDDVECEGTEEKLLDCNHNTKDDCKGNEGLGVICTPKKGEVQEPTHNEMKCVLSIKESYSKGEKAKIVTNAYGKGWEPLGAYKLIAGRDMMCISSWTLNFDDFPF